MITHRYALPALATLALVGGLTVGTFTPSPGVGAPTPTDTRPVLMEDDPGWDCTLDGDRICGPLTDAARAAGWRVWDEQQGTRSLRVDPSRPYRVEYRGTSARPKLADNETALVGRDFQWHVFAAVYTD